MRTVIVGVGGIGGFLGGRLAAGLSEERDQELVLWCRGETLKNIREKGLTLLDQDGRATTVRPDLATNRASDVGAADLVLFATKSYDLEAAILETAPFITEQTRVIPLLNGVCAVDLLEQHLPQADVLGGCIYTSSHVRSPGTVQAVGSVQRLFFGKHGLSSVENRVRYADVEQFLRKSGLQVTLTARIAVEMWSKFVFLSPFAAATTFYGRSIGAVLVDSEAFETVMGLIGELEALARAHKVPLPENIADLTVEKARSFDSTTRTSMQLDQEQGRMTELDCLIGYVCREAAAQNLPVPNYDRIYAALLETCRA
ncbi:MAG: 2-dehydropantoate 2-reductase [Fretibacterium sp.]|nr:2-dehydropantoate 2-reductase [Fretibacterium sp.]